MSDNSIPQATSEVLDKTGRFRVEWFRFFTDLEGLRRLVSDTEGELAGSVEELAIRLAALEADFDQLIEELDNATITDCWSHFIPYAENDTVRMIPKIPFAGTITSCVTDADSGTCTVRPQIDGVNVGTSSNAVSTTEVEVTYTSANTFTAGQTIGFVLSGNSNATGVSVQLTYTRSLF